MSAEDRSSGRSADLSPVLGRGETTLTRWL